MRIAASTYLNSAPLVYSFAAGGLRSDYEFIGDTAPSRCAELLAAGECEIALIPAIEYQRIPGLRIIPGVAVASKSRVRSVLIASRCPLSEVRTLAMDTSSRTSQSLVRILFQHQFGWEPELIRRTPDRRSGYENMLDGTDAALVIGDPAMRIEAAAASLGVTIHDLALEWRKLTGQPFVFAVWAVREEVLSTRGAGAKLTNDFQLAKREGIGRLAEIAAGYVTELELPLADLTDYLESNVNYELDEENLAGLRGYYDLAHRYGLIPAARRLEFLSGNATEDLPENPGKIAITSAAMGVPGVADSTAGRRGR